MSKIIIYTKPGCLFSSMAKKILNNNEIKYEEISLKSKEEREMQKEKTNYHTFPQIFIEDELIGGYSELKELNKKKQLK